MSRVIGIDLGTTNCCVAVVDGARPVVLPNKSGYRTTPSVVAVTEDGRRLVGQPAVRQAITNPQHTVHASKRLIGRRFDSPQVRQAIETCAFEIVEGPNSDVRIRLRDKDHSVPEIAAILLQEVRLLAEDHLRESVGAAVVTVPAYFNDNQRQAVRDAGRIAGLDVLRILNEPTAAAIAYGFDRQEPRTIAIYDMGGGTFDVSIVRIDPEQGFEVVATTGDSFLGGEDFDDRIVAWLLEVVHREHGVDLSDSPVALQRMRQAAQKAKCDLSEAMEAEVQLPFLVAGARPVSLEAKLRRAELESMSADLLTRSLQICERALKLAGIRVADLHDVVLVGGMTRMPAVQRAVTDFFDREPCRGVHPDEAVALGAALVGAELAEQGGDAQSGMRRVVGPLRDVVAHSLGIMVAGGKFDVLIPAMSPVPAHTTSVFATSRDGQDTVKIVVLQGESQTAKENEFLGQFALAGLRPAPAGEVEIEVSFDIDADGIFRVGALDRETRKAQAIHVLARSGISEPELRTMIDEAAAHMADRRAVEDHERARQGVEVALAQLERLLPEVERLPPTTIAPITLARARQVSEQVRRVARDSDPSQLASHAREIEEITASLKRVLR